MHSNDLTNSSSIPAKSTALQVALLGNPNSGKTSLFNQLTGLRQKVGNFPGVTVDRKVGKLNLGNDLPAELVDLPGTYSFFATSQDERIVAETLTDPSLYSELDLFIYVADATKLDKHLLFFSQLRDLGKPMILVLNMADILERESIKLDIAALEKKLLVPIVLASGRTGEGIDNLLGVIRNLQKEIDGYTAPKLFYQPTALEERAIKVVQQKYPYTNPYQALQVAHHVEWLSFINEEDRTSLRQDLEALGFQDLPQQVEETMSRYSKLEPLTKPLQRTENTTEQRLTDRIDRFVTHPILGPILFFGLMAVVFQAIFTWAGVPMDLIDGLFGEASNWIKETVPVEWLANLLGDGIITGLGGVLIFIPQIAILFFLISLLEEVGYMARAAFMFDRIMQFFGLNGRSVVALISGGACAIPAVMSTRTIKDWKERLITIMVTPLISCSARIPVYTVLIAFVVPPDPVWGIFTLQGLAFLGLYLLGIIGALVSALIFKLILKAEGSSMLTLELPAYRMPVWRNVGLTVWEKVKVFSLEAGRVILVISIALWFLVSYGLPGSFEKAEQDALTLATELQLDEDATQQLVASKQMEASFAGRFGKAIEPAIEPLGYDWKIGIALLTSFAAREVFIGTMATIYSIGEEDDETRIQEKMAKEKDPITGEPVYTLATSLSLLLFYVFAMQCMATLAVVKRETNSWKWPIIQFLFMGVLAYGSAFAAYQLLS